MKIAKIEFENLNSLKGKWCIDFTNPDYEIYHNLFVISGHTGSGKTTILDAITLALYGRTARQEKVTKTINELMTSKTGYCSAKVTYMCKAGYFESEFYQQRARKSITGELQNPECNITKCDGSYNSGKIASTNLEIETEKITHLSYDQFSRSIMLAQGQFDTFIMGTERERAAILAKLSGTEFYKAIGSRIWDKASFIEKDLERIKKEKENLILLTDEELAKLTAEKANKETENSKIQKELDEITNAVIWWEKFDKYQTEYMNAQKQRKEYEAEIAYFAQDEIKLKNAEKAINCKPEYQLVTQTENDIQIKTKQIQKLESELVIKTKEHKDAITQTETEQDKLQKAERQRTEDIKIWKKVRDYDAQLKPLFESKEKAKEKKEESQRNYTETKSTIAKIAKEIETLKNQIAYLDEYITSHNEDSKLLALNPELIIKHKELEAILQTISDTTTKIEVNAIEIEKQKEKLTQAIVIFNNLQDEVKNLVSKEFVAISLLLKNQLKDGKPCPVCGSVDHPSCANESTTNTSQQTSKVIFDVTRLHKKIEEAETEKRNTESFLTKLQEENDRLQNENQQLKKNSDCIVKELNLKIALWNVTILVNQNCKTNFNDIISDLENRSLVYENNCTEKEKSKNALTIQQTKLDAVNIELLENEMQRVQDDFTKCEKAFSDVNMQRQALFGDKKPDIEEEKAENSILELKKTLTNKEIRRNELYTSKSNIETSITTCKNDIKTLQDELFNHTKQLKIVFSKNGFTSKEEFITYCITDSELALLKSKKSILINRDGATDNALKTAQKNVDSITAQKITTKDKSILAEEKEEKRIKLQENIERIVTIRNQFDQNTIQQKKAQEIEKQYAKIKEQNSVWQEMRRLIGIKDGSEFETFVQALAFKPLLSIANKYILDITKKYSLVQVKNKVDFLVHDINYPDSKDDRPITNMSGGEKFVISLSLALGIAEIASRNVRVDSLFLDEGFGTLSGEPLSEAIAALKSLQTKGKMLGIITHIEQVINEFNLKIEAKKIFGISELKGPGVTRLG